MVRNMVDTYYKPSSPFLDDRVYSLITPRNALLVASLYCVHIFCVTIALYTYDIICFASWPPKTGLYTDRASLVSLLATVVRFLT